MPDIESILTILAVAMLPALAVYAVACRLGVVPVLSTLFPAIAL